MAIGEFYPNTQPTRQHLKGIYDYLTEHGHVIITVYEGRYGRVRVIMGEVLDNWQHWEVPGYQMYSCTEKDPMNYWFTTCILEPE